MKDLLGLNLRWVMVLVTVSFAVGFNWTHIARFFGG